ncbi:hypothetical protein [Thiobacillus denitrificans]|uniref:HMA domain-containing protein n=1 Tax=Thiobacillus denitrificans TaxID=36861 RepID=A0A106BRB0_THIDE|nr:hypothetical protein [Thiobacillus denitrificans]KVW97191.1 hypothetical protein ABW22_05085 [Thiobacillus denitrificans]
MKTETLNIVGPLNAEAGQRAGASLKAIAGVHEVSFVDSPACLQVSIDDKTATRAQLIAVLAAAGVQVEEKKNPHASGSCCGGCGS